jgi:hypothetical protein
MVRHRLVSIRHALLAAPPFVVTIGLAVFAGAELSGSHPLTIGEPRSVAEAIALGDDAGAARQIEDGAGVNEIGLIRSGILFEHPLLATPIEAAVLVDSAAAFDYLTSRGAHVAPEISCLARDIGVRAVSKSITDSPSCPPGAALQAVLDRP